MLVTAQRSTGRNISRVVSGNYENCSQLGERPDPTEAEEQGARGILGRFIAESDGDSSENPSESISAEKSSQAAKVGVEWVEIFTL